MFVFCVSQLIFIPFFPLFLPYFELVEYFMIPFHLLHRIALCKCQLGQDSNVFLSEPHFAQPEMEVVVFVLEDCCEA